MPMNARGSRKSVGDVDANTISFHGLNRRPMHLTVKCPAVRDQTGRNFMSHRFGNQMINLHTVHDFPGKSGTVRSDHRRVVPARFTRTNVVALLDLSGRACGCIFIAGIRSRRIHSPEQRGTGSGSCSAAYKFSTIKHKFSG